MTNPEIHGDAVCDCYAVVGHHNGCASRRTAFPEPRANPHTLSEAWDAAIQLADDEGCLLYHQAKGLKAANPLRDRQVIPDAAVEAAAVAVYGAECADLGADEEPKVKASYLSDARAALEAAAPHMLEEAKADAWDEGKNVRRCDGVPPNPYRSQE